MEAELVFIPSPVPGHLSSAIEIAKLLVHRDSRILVTILVIKPSDPTPTSTATIDHRIRIRIVELPSKADPDKTQVHELIIAHKPHVKDFVINLTKSTRKLLGFMIDIFSTEMIDVADELGVPTYMYYTSSATFLNLQFRALKFLDGSTNYPSCAEFIKSQFEDGGKFRIDDFNIPDSVEPDSDKEWDDFGLDHAKEFKRTKGILINTFKELESNALESFLDFDTPKLYGVGPILNPELDNKSSDIIEWLDHQTPNTKVVVVCFGMIDEEQVKAIRKALGDIHKTEVNIIAKAKWREYSTESIERIKFLLALGRPHDLNEALPGTETAEFIKMIDGTPSVSVLAHPAVKGLVTHYDWNSMLDSLRFGVPTATWPLYAGQQLSASSNIVNLGLSIDIKKDFCRNDSFSLEVVSPIRIEGAIRWVMKGESKKWIKLKELSEISRLTGLEGGSSYTALGCFIKDVFDSYPC